MPYCHLVMKNFKMAVGNYGTAPFMKDILRLYSLLFRFLKSVMRLLRIEKLQTHLLPYPNLHFSSTAKPIIENESELNKGSKYLFFRGIARSFYLDFFSNMTPSRHLEIVYFYCYMKQ